MPYQDDETWDKARKVWELDAREGYAWLVRETGLDVSGPAVRKRAITEGWVKSADAVSNPKTKKPKTENPKPEKVRTEICSHVQDLDFGDNASASECPTQTRVYTQSLEHESAEELKDLYENKGHGNSRYRPQYAKLAYKHCLLGATPEHVAALLDVHETIVYDWMKAYPAFGAAIREGRDAADANVAKSLYKRATGFQYQAVKIFQFQGEEVVIPYTEVVPPDTGAAMFWLKNRQPELWKDRVEVEEKQTIALVDKAEMERIYTEALAIAERKRVEMLDREKRLLIECDAATGVAFVRDV